MKINKLKWLIFISYILLVALNQFLWINFVTISDVVSKIYNVSEFYVGLLAIIFPIVYVIISIPTGIFIDKKGYKMSLLIASVVMTVFSFVRILQMDYTLLLIGQIGIAFAQPFINNSVSKLANTEFPQEKVPLIIGLGSLAIFLGVGAGMLLPSILYQYLGYFTMMLLIAIISLIILILFIFSLIPLGLSEKIMEMNKISFLRILRIRDLLILSSITFVGMGVFNGILTWIQPILSHLKISDIEMGIDGLIFVIGGMIGSIIIPTLVTFYGKRRIFIILAFFISIPILFLIPFIMDLITMFIITFLLGFFMLGSFPVLIDWGTLISGVENAGSATSFLWFLGQIGGFIIPIFMGILGPMSPNNTFLYAMVFSGLFFLALLPFIFMARETQKIISPGKVSQ
ncbi:MAG: MFS transporter [Thermoplasmata archaeon]